MALNTAELTGALLNFWVAKAEGYRTELRWRNGELRAYVFVVTRDYPEGYPRCFDPSNDWIEGGPLLSQMIEGGEFNVWEYGGMVTVSNMDQEGLPCKEPCRDDIAVIQCEDKKLLIAAMRAFVAWKFGDEVEDTTIPEE